MSGLNVSVHPVVFIVKSHKCQPHGGAKFKKSEDHQSHYDSSFGEHECLVEILVATPLAYPYPVLSPISSFIYKVQLH